MFATVGLMLALVASTVVQVHTDPGSAAGPLGTLGSYVLGIGSVALTGVVKGWTQKADAAVGRVDTALTSAYKPFQPLIATGLAFLLPTLGQKLHVPILGQLDPGTVAAAPLGVLTAIAAREGLAKLGGLLGVPAGTGG